jgi:preprotein translocase subunit SecA
MQAGHVVGVPVGDRRGPILILAAYLHCLVRASVHVVVVDNTLASSLANQMIGVMNLLGVTAAALSDSPDFAEDKAAYRADVVVGPSTRFCYDYLTDCLTLSPDELIQPSRRVAIVAEADVLLLDEATQLRIIGSDYVSDARQYERAKELASTAIRGVHYTYAPGTSRLNFTPTGLALIQESLGVTDLEELSLLRDVQHVYDAFIAKDSFQRGRDYQVRAGVVHPVPWLQRNLRYAAGILQAIEAKEDLFVSDENLAEARIRAGDYFRLYETLTGIASIPTGALAAELRQRYNIQVADNPDELQSGEVSVRRRDSSTWSPNGMPTMSRSSSPPARLRALRTSANCSPGPRSHTPFWLPNPNIRLRTGWRTSADRMPSPSPKGEPDADMTSRSARQPGSPPCRSPSWAWESADPPASTDGCARLPQTTAAVPG